MCFDCEGSSPSQMMAVWSPRFSRWRSMQFQATLRTPSSNHLIEMLPGGEGDVLDLVGGLHPVDALGLFGPEAVGIADRAGIHLAVLGVVDIGALGPVRGHVVDLLGHLSLHSLRPLAAAASRLDCCNDYASRGVARTRRKRLRPWSSGVSEALFLIKGPCICRFGRAKNQRYCRNGSHERYLITINNRIETRNANLYPLNGLPGARRPSGTKPQ